MFLLSIAFLLCCIIEHSTSYQRPRDGYNTFTDSSTYIPFHNLPYNNPKWNEPYFDISIPNNVTALFGKSAYLSCRVKNLGNRTVSWIRHRDIHILTVGTYTYTTDERFQTTFHRDSNEWTMQIKYSQIRDAGTYECQVSTQPIKSYSVQLNVVVPTASILGGPEMYVEKGSTINLTCIIQFSPEPPIYIFWYHQDRVIDYASTRGGVSMRVQKGEITTSYLLIHYADLPDSGKYTCAPSNANMTSIRVDVLNGERPEAMQTGTSAVSNRSIWTLVIAIIISIFCSNFLGNIQIMSQVFVNKSTLCKLDGNHLHSHPLNGEQNREQQNALVAR